jgi:ubiquinone/menaquinone biosynthesis C-methylase UbiE
MKDRFSSISQAYKDFRPTYPEAWYRWLFAHVAHAQRAWDVGTGNGQVAVRLAQHFAHVVASDISAKQLALAPRLANVSYEQTGDRITCPDQSVDLVTVGQALHWFDLENFYAEVRRVVRPEGLVAVWGYSLIELEKAFQPEMVEFYTQEVGPYWDPERTIIEDHYRSLSFPFHELEVPRFNFSFEWTIDHLQGYLGSWSAVQRYRADRNADPVERFIKNLRPRWGGMKKRVNFPFFARVGRAD